MNSGAQRYVEMRWDTDMAVLTQDSPQDWTVDPVVAGSSPVRLALPSPVRSGVCAAFGGALETVLDAADQRSSGFVTRREL